jgi:subtilisin family serine protease
VVGATDNRDLPSFFSDYGSGSVEIFAPGENILSTSNARATSYGYLSGTSLATPFVTGAVALLRAEYPSDTYRETINRILNCADSIPALAGLAQTGGRLDLANALATAAKHAAQRLVREPHPSRRPRSLHALEQRGLAGGPEPGTPTVAGTAGVHSLWWQWTAPEDASVEIDTSGTGGGMFLTGGSTYATLLGVYTGSSLGSLTLVKDNAQFGTEPLEGASGTVPYSEVTFQAAAGTTYQILVQGQSAQSVQSGQTILAINTDPNYDSISSPRILSGPSVSVLDANPNASRQAGSR